MSGPVRLNGSQPTDRHAHSGGAAAVAAAAPTVVAITTLEENVPLQINTQNRRHHHPQLPEEKDNDWVKVALFMLCLSV